jgi:gas vesicle protein
MAVVVAAPPALSGDLALYHTTDPLLANSPLLIFHGAATSFNASSSRIQVHIFTPAGLGSYARLAVTPNSPLYSAVSNLPREEQGDEVCRSIAFGLKKYFSELPDGVKKAWQAQSRTPLAALFTDDHIAILASRMTRIENVEEVTEDLARVFGEQKLPWIDVDVVLPSGTIKEHPKRTDSGGPDLVGDAEAMKHRYGQYADLIAALGEPSFLPTSKLRRAPSKANSAGRSASFAKEQKENARKEISELFETEGNYVSRMRELESLAETLGNDLNASGKQQLKEILPDVIHDVATLNMEFFEALREVLNSTEETAMKDIEEMSEDQPTAQQARQDVTEDTQGIVAIAKCFCEWFPKFADAYISYMRSHASAERATGRRHCTIDGPPRGWRAENHFPTYRAGPASTTVQSLH